MAEGKADMVALARGFLDNPHWGWAAARELGADVERPPQYLRVAPKLWPAADAGGGPGVAALTGPRPMAMRNLAIDPERLWGELMETAAIGGTAKGGICRLTLTDLDRQVRDWFRARCEGLGLTVTVDDMGVMFARRAGQRDDLPPIALGSHLDTQPTGGKFDGVLGVLGALEAVRTLVEAGYETYRADRGGELDQRGGLALRPVDDRVRRVRRRVHARLGDRAHRPRGHDLRRRRSMRSATAAPSHAGSIRCRRSSSCTSSRARCSKRRARRSASSPACRACAGTR